MKRLVNPPLDRRFYRTKAKGITSAKRLHIGRERLFGVALSLWQAGFNNQQPAAHGPPPAEVTEQTGTEGGGELERVYPKNDSGMVPLGSLMDVQRINGPDADSHYNVYPTSLIQGTTLPGVSSGQAIAKMERICRENLPSQFSFEWTRLTYQEVTAGNTAIFIFPFFVLFVFLALAAQYESWSLPLAVILIVPMCLLSAMVGVYFRGQDNNIFTQIGFIVLVGLACKNAILIVEFARQQMESGMGRIEAAAEAARLRLRPILMTSFAFILGVLPLVIAKGAGAEMDQALGTAVFAGMIGVTFFGIFFIPIFFSLIMKIFGRAPKKQRPRPTEHRARRGEPVH